MTGPIKAVLWDVGGVFTGRPYDAAARAAADHQLDTDDVFAAIFGPYHLDGDHPWHRLERGEMSLGDAWPLIEAELTKMGVPFALSDFFGYFGHDDADRTIVSDTLSAVKQAGLATCIVTNNVKEFGEREDGGWQQMVPMQHMDHVIDSSAVGCRKPDPTIYHLALDTVGVAAHEAIFVDDMAANVDAAIALGIHGFVVGPDPTEAMQQVQQLALG